MHALLRALRPPAVTERWTLEESARYAAHRDVEILKLLLADKRLLAAARRLQFLPPAQPAGSVHGHAAAAAGSTLAHDDAARPEGARADNRPPRAGGAGAAVAPGPPERRAAARRRPRKRSGEKVAEREAKFEQKRRRRKLFEVLPVVGAYMRRTGAASGGAGDSSMQLAAAGGAGGAHPGADVADAVGAAAGGAGGGEQLPPAPLAGAKRSCARRGSTSAGAGGEAHGKRCAGSTGGPIRPAAAVAVGGAKGSEPYSCTWRDACGTEYTQWYGCCGECGRAHMPVFDVNLDPARRLWLCESCRSARLVWS